jgi:AraC-like DNA-binding protein
MGRYLVFGGQSNVRDSYPMEAGTLAFEDIHAVAARLAARRLSASQKLVVDRDARKLSQTVGARRPEVKVQIQRIAFIDEVAKLVGDDCLGFHLATETNTRELGIIHYILSASGTALDAVKNLIRYHHLVNTTTSLVIDESNRHVTIDATFRPGLESLEKHIAEWGTTIFVAELRRLTDTRMVPQSVSFIHRRNPTVKEFTEFFGCPVRFGTNRQSIVFATNDLLVPIQSADAHLLNILKVFSEEALSRRKTPPTPTRARVEKTLLDALPKGNATISNVAGALAMSVRSLARRLNEEGSSYTEILDDLRRELAMRYVEDKTLGLSQIAWLLGYSEVSSFNHAFKRWTSQSPRALRTDLKSRDSREPDTFL